MSKYEEKIGFLSLAPLPVLYERATDQRLTGKPFVVVGAIGNRGLVVACSPEAFRAGIRPGLTPDMAERFLPGLIDVEERPALYYESSLAVQDLCERFVPIVEAEKQDSFTLDLTGTDRIYPNTVDLVRKLQTAIEKDVLLPSRAGLASSRLIARLAALRAQEKNLRAIPSGHEAEFLADYDVTVLPGVGARITERLRWLGIRTVRELARVPIRTLEAAFGPRGIELARAASGHDPRPRRHAENQKPLKKDTTIEQLFYDPLAVRVAAERLIAALGVEMRSQRKQVRKIALEIRYPDIPPKSRVKKIPPTDIDALLTPIIADMLNAMFDRRVRLRGLALTYSDLIPSDEQIPFDFARDHSFDRLINLQSATDKIRSRWGTDSIGPGTWR